MTKKVIITKNQLNIISNYISENEIVRGTLDGDLINENFKSVALSILLLSGANLSGQNKSVADDALKNHNIINQVKSVLSDMSKLDNMIIKIDKIIPNSGEKIKNNLYQIQTSLEDLK